MILNNKQLEAINHKEGACIVLAGAGSGKTRVLTERIIKLLENNISPHEILAITFTNKAAKEMRDRVSLKYNDADKIFIGTFHSFGLKVLRENYIELGYSQNINILDSDDSKSLIKRILKDNGYDSDKYDIKNIISKISMAKNEGISPLEYSKLFLTDFDKAVYKVYEDYLKVLHKNNSVDFDDLLIKPIELFKNKSILQKYQDHYKYILVDEYQDTNSIQYEMCKLLSSKYKNIFVVGDMQQSIYSWRNADFRNLIKFKNDYKDCKTILLEENYRSTNNILKAANSIIKNNSEGEKLNLWSSLGEGELIEYIRCEDELKEASYVTNKIKDYISLGYKYSDFAILYRTNAQSRTIEEAFVKSNIPYNIIGSYFFYNRKEIKDLIAYLNVIYNKNDSVSLERIINVPKRGIGNKTIEELRNKANALNCSMFDAISDGKELLWKEMILELIYDSKQCSLSQLIENVLIKTGLRKEYEDNLSLENELKIENLNEFKSLAVSFEDNGIYDLESFLENIMLVSDSNQYKNDNEKVTLMTLHSAKGLEFKIVFILGLEEGIFPHSRSFENASELEEERRLCYVGITRAKSKLYLLNTKKRTLFGKTTISIPSRFVKEIDNELLKIDSPSENDNSKIISNMYNSSSNLKSGDRISHTIFGDGIVISIINNIASIAFKHQVGIKQIAANHKSITKRN